MSAATKTDDQRKAIGMYLTFLKAMHRAMPEVMVGPVHHDLVRICSQMMDRMDPTVSAALEEAHG